LLALNFQVAAERDYVPARDESVKTCFRARKLGLAFRLIRSGIETNFIMANKKKTVVTVVTVGCHLW
jgi:hypothetical protein